jgi:copper chaperone CopZ
MSESTTLAIEGMTCGHCKANVEKALKAVPGVTDVTVDLTKHQAVIAGSASRSSLVQAVQDAGYTVAQ